jgi:allophanate hydrolase subunit 2
VLGSRSHDQLGGIGPAPLRAGDSLPIGAEPDRPPYWEVAPVRDIDPEPTLRIVAGPRDDWLLPPGIRQLTDERWTVLPMSDRTGLRLSGPRIGRRDGELPSEGLVPGAVQLPADGAPILLGPDAGVTGGYPAVAVVVDADLDRLGQLAPGARLGFRLLR